VDIAKNSPLKPLYWHYWISLLLGVALLPVLRSQHLPLKFDWMTITVAYWLVLAAQSIFVAVLLCVIGLPRDQTLGPFLAPYRANPLRIVPLLLFLAILIWTTSWMKALILGVDAVALLEVVNRQKTSGLRHAAFAVFAPAAYLFFGFAMVLAYNYAIVSVRFNFATDPALAAIDRWLLLGHSVSELTHWAVRVFPLSFFRTLEFIYFGMFSPDRSVPYRGRALLWKSPRIAVRRKRYSCPTTSLWLSSTSGPHKDLTTSALPTSPASPPVCSVIPFKKR
jgi:hypothetical protein